MKITLNFMGILILLLMSNCKKDNQPTLLDHDCFKKSTQYNSSDEVTYWRIFYYLDSNNIRQEDSEGDIREMEYDHLGNRISYSYNENKIEYEYNRDNQVFKTNYYTNNQLDYYSISVYIDGLVHKVYQIDNNNDTIWSSSCYYNSEDQIDSVITNNDDRYYYYSSDIDSVIILSKEKDIKSRNFFKYENGRKVYAETRSYNIFGQEHQYFINNWEYNDKGLLIRQTKDHLFASGETRWIDQRKYYNGNDDIIRIETYDEDNNIQAYSKYYYENMILERIESFDNNDTLYSYTIIEDLCDN